jgi:hypothetical protein
VIVNESTYNPLKNIFNLLDTPTVMNRDLLEDIKKELSLGGINIEDSDDFTPILLLILETHKQYYGN